MRISGKACTTSVAAQRERPVSCHTQIVTMALIVIQGTCLMVLTASLAALLLLLPSSVRGDVCRVRGFENKGPIDPDACRNVTEIIRDKGYPVEEHRVTTSDGFVINIQRMPDGHKARHAKGPKPVVFLQHGLLSSSADWVINYPPESLGYILADAGYDVWLGNVRGNTYSSHVKYTRKDKQFWDFSFDEMIKYDLPAMLDYVLNTTQQTKLFYVGHSQGTLILFALLSERPEYNKKIQLFSAMGPVTNVTYMTSPVRLLAPFAKDAGVLFRLFGDYDFLPNNWFMRFLAKTMCKYHALREVCEDAIFLIVGTDMHELNVTRLPVFISHTPAGTSVKNMIHFAQLVREKRFQKFDYGSSKNMAIYGQKIPPVYNVSGVKIPVGLFWSLNDWFADPADVNILTKQLPNIIFNYQVPDPEFTHLDFIVGIHANDIVYSAMMKLMDRHRKKAYRF
ncbi:lysosomal acid lipase/cholesteryl ester hydrolase [Rhipicephalus sanguineus]|uniref:lysosomal acid lipase/cholesteryl ester hydrolase n=1 Tax=Rhipicephalus sanguineus TaxID=34632 RepID=UPI0018959DD2|nr:lysosomal acid lipase/cholesteryl ester hydrolase [Rhipicephalus sanguineus]